MKNSPPIKQGTQRSRSGIYLEELNKNSSEYIDCCYIVYGSEDLKTQVSYGTFKFDSISTTTETILIMQRWREFSYRWGGNYLWYRGHKANSNFPNTKLKTGTDLTM
ncbi:hypothetical protein PV325_011333 [Microctonus aethiopoides]|nr:hypothetical protein PV325_011333 [Microctonus aethiopoides]KAK0097100.1 hypothetical protein PV326_003298 [Microctonus aethiopoides]